MKAGRGFEPDGESYLINRQVGLTEKPCGFLQTDVPEILAKGLVVSLFEFLRESGAVSAHGTTDVFACQIFVAEEIVATHYFFELEAELIERILRNRGLQRNRCRTWNTFDS